MTGIDSNEVWSQIQIRVRKVVFGMTSVTMWHKGGINFECKTTKDKFLCEVVDIFFRSCQINDHLLSHYLYGVLISEDVHAVSLASYKWRVFGAEDRLDRLSVPQRYVHEADSALFSDLWKRFFHSCQWFPTVVELTACHLRTVSQCNILQQLLLCVEEIRVNLAIIYKEFDPVTPAILSATLHAVVSVAKMNALKSISLETNYGDYLHWLIFQLLLALKVDSSADVKLYNCIKRLKIVCQENLPSMEDLLQLISLQKGMEVLIIHCLDAKNEPRRWCTRLLPVDKSLGILYCYLPHFLSKPCFQLLRVESSKVAFNAMKKMITAFLNNPACHDQCLEFFSCEVVGNFIDMPLPLGECELQVASDLHKAVEQRCVAGEHKSLSVPVGEPLFPLQWLADFTGFRLKRLDLQLIVPYDIESQEYCFSETSEALGLFSRSVDTLCVTLITGCCEECHHNVSEVLKSPSLAELQIVGPCREQTFSVLTSSIQSAKSLRLIRFKGGFHFTTYRHFFNAVFSTPTNQLADLTLDFSECTMDHDWSYNSWSECIIQAWRENAGGQKIKSIRCSNCSGLQDMATELIDSNV